VQALFAALDGRLSRAVGAVAPPVAEDGGPSAWTLVTRWQSWAR
jgi:hypothetical protein